MKGGHGVFGEHGSEEEEEEACGDEDQLEGVRRQATARMMRELGLYGNWRCIRQGPLCQTPCITTIAIGEGRPFGFPGSR